LENTVKAYTGEYNGLLDPKLFEKKKKAESDLRAKVQGDPEWRREYGSGLGRHCCSDEKRRRGDEASAESIDQRGTGMAGSHGNRGVRPPRSRSPMLSV